MKAAICTGPREPIEIAQVPDPACPGDGVVVEVRACGVCRSDHHAWAGADPDVAFPHVMGHEFAGVVAEVGPECRGFAVGDRVTAPFILGCGHCATCRAGEPTACDAQEVIGFTSWGAFAERLPVPRADYNLVRLPDALDFVAAAGMGCRVTTAYRGIVDRAGLAPGEWLAVHGCGGVGLSAVMIGAALGARVLAVDVNGAALDMARALGASAVLNAAGGDLGGDAGGDVGAAARDLTGGGAQVSVDALGIAATFDASLRSLAKLGRHVQIGMPVGEHAVVPLPLLELVYARQLTLHGSRGMGAPGFPALLGMIEAGRLDPARLVTGTIPLSGVEAALRRMDGYAGHGVTVIDRMDG